MLNKKSVDSSTIQKNTSLSVTSAQKISYFEMDDGTLIK